MQYGFGMAEHEYLFNLTQDQKTLKSRYPLKYFPKYGNRKLHKNHLFKGRKDPFSFYNSIKYWSDPRKENED